MHLLTISFILGVAKAILVPSPPGPYSVTVKHIELFDPNRIDTFAPKPNTKRRYMVSAYLPIDAQYDCKAQVVPYMPALTADAYGKVGVELGLPRGIVGEFEMEFCDISTVRIDKNNNNNNKKEFPIVVFSPGQGGTRLVYGALARSLASQGYIVMTVDHPYEAVVVEFPDGSVAWAANPDLDNSTVVLQELELRTGDESFLISQLSNKTFTERLFNNFPGTFNPHKVAAYGHSFGGSTAAVTVQRDPRVVGGLNFDGAIYGSVGKEGFKNKPFVQVASAEFNNTPILNWDEIYKNIDATKMELAVKDTRHYGFTDVPLLLTVYELPPASQPKVDDVFGTLNGRKIEKAVNDIMVGALDLLFHNKTRLLKRLGKNPDIDVLLSDFPKCK